MTTKSLRYGRILKLLQDEREVMSNSTIPNTTQFIDGMVNSEKEGGEKMTTVPGCDVSTYQGMMDWDKAIVAGMRYAYIRSSYGNKGVDAQFERNKIALVNRGVPLGCYHFLNPDLDWKKQFELAFDGDAARQLRRRDLPDDADYCSMCGRDWCALRISRELKQR